MKTVKVKDKRRWGHKSITEVGAIHPSPKDGTFELEDHQAKILIEGDDSFCYLEDYEGPTGKPVEDINQKSEEVEVFNDLDAEELAELQDLQKLQQTQSQLQSTTIVQQVQEATNELTKSEDASAIKEEVRSITEEEKAIYRAELSSKTKAELTELAKPFPGGEWRSLIKKDLIEYLITKMS